MSRTTDRPRLRARAMVSWFGSVFTFKRPEIYRVRSHLPICFLRQSSFQQCSIQQQAREQGKVVEPTNM